MLQNGATYRSKQQGGGVIVKEHMTIQDYKVENQRLQQKMLIQFDEINRLHSLIVELFKASISGKEGV